MWQFTGKQRPSFALPPGEGQESVWDYPRPPVCVKDSRKIVVACGTTTIAETTHAIRVLETASPPTVYLPPQDVDLACLRRESGSSFCEWKGQATYWSVVTADAEIKNAGWSYDNPTAAFQEIAGYLSFYPALLACTIDGETVRPQPGEFYGGWVTNEIVGPCKGQPGTSGW
jgi:uncharacterized protein (DUF427 family)